RLFGVHVVVTVERTHHSGSPHGLGLGEKPVGSLFGMIEELDNEVFVRTAGALGNPMLFGVNFVYLDAQFIHVMRIDGTETTAAAVPAGCFLHDGHFSALFGSSSGSSASGNACTDNKNIGVNR